MHQLGFRCRQSGMAKPGKGAWQAAAHLAAEIDAPGPAVVVIVALIIHKAAVLDDLPVQPKDVDGQVVTALARV